MAGNLEELQQFNPFPFDFGGFRGEPSWLPNYSGQPAPYGPALQPQQPQMDYGVPDLRGYISMGGGGGGVRSNNLYQPGSDPSRLGPFQGTAGGQQWYINPNTGDMQIFEPRAFGGVPPGYTLASNLQTWGGPGSAPRAPSTGNPAADWFVNSRPGFTPQTPQMGGYPPPPGFAPQSPTGGQFPPELGDDPNAPRQPRQQRSNDPGALPPMGFYPSEMGGPVMVDNRTQNNTIAPPGLAPPVIPGMPPLPPMDIQQLPPQNVNYGDRPPIGALPEFRQLIASNVQPQTSPVEGPGKNDPLGGLIAQLNDLGGGSGGAVTAQPPSTFAPVPGLPLGAQPPGGFAQPSPQMPMMPFPMAPQGYPTAPMPMMPPQMPYSSPYGMPGFADMPGGAGEDSYKKAEDALTNEKGKLAEYAGKKSPDQLLEDEAKALYPDNWKPSLAQRVGGFFGKSPRNTMEALTPPSAEEMRRRYKAGAREGDAYKEKERDYRADRRAERDLQKDVTKQEMALARNREARKHQEFLRHRLSPDTKQELEADITGMSQPERIPILQDLVRSGVYSRDEAVVLMAAPQNVARGLNRTYDTLKKFYGVRNAEMLYQGHVQKQQLAEELRPVVIQRAKIQLVKDWYAANASKLRGQASEAQIARIGTMIGMAEQNMDLKRQGLAARIAGLLAGVETTIGKSNQEWNELDPSAVSSLEQLHGDLASMYQAAQPALQAPATPHPGTTPIPRPQGPPPPGMQAQQGRLKSGKPMPTPQQLKSLKR